MIKKIIFNKADLLFGGDVFFSSEKNSKVAFESKICSKEFKLRPLAGLWSSCCFMAIAGLSQVAVAEETGEAKASRPVLENIVVTAQKRSETVNDVPLAITAVSSDDIALKRIVSMEDLTMVSPGVNVGNQQGKNRLFIRGIGVNSFAAGADSSSAFHMDGVYVARPAAQLTSFFDIDRIEVLRGPQGTLYGRNATAGSVNVITRRPTEEFEGELSLTYGKYNLLEVMGSVSGALNEEGSLRGRIAFKDVGRDGYGRNKVAAPLGNPHPIDDENRQAIRATVEYDMSDSVRFTFLAEYGKEDDHNYVQHGFGPFYSGTRLPGVEFYGASATHNSRDVSNAAENVNQRESFSLTAITNIDINENIDITSITAFREYELYHDLDGETSTYPAGPVSYDEDSKQYSQELQLNYTNDSLKGVAGIYYFFEDLSNRVAAPFDEQNLGPVDAPVFIPGALYEQNATSDITSYAAFTQWTYSLTDAFRVTAGVRYSYEERTNEGFFAGIGVPVALLDEKENWSSVTPKVGVDYDLTEDIMIFASYTEGFKSGLFNVGQVNGAIDPEEITSYEIGVKGTLFDETMDFAMTAFMYDYTDLQVNKLIGIGTQTVNAAEAENQGIEFSFRALATDNLIINGDITFVDATFNDFLSTSPLDPGAGEVDLSGNVLPGAPEWGANLGAEYTFALESGATITSRLDINYRDKVYFDEFNEEPTSQKAVTKANASIRYEPSEVDSWSLLLWAKNITDEKVKASNTRGIGLWGFPLQGAYEPPRTYGVTLNMAF